MVVKSAEVDIHSAMVACGGLWLTWYLLNAIASLRDKEGRALGGWDLWSDQELNEREKLALIESNMPTKDQKM